MHPVSMVRRLSPVRIYTLIIGFLTLRLVADPLKNTMSFLNKYRFCIGFAPLHLLHFQPA